MARDEMNVTDSPQPSHEAMEAARLWWYFQPGRNPQALALLLDRFAAARVAEARAQEREHLSREIYAGVMMWAASVRAIAFEIPAPNAYTPRLVSAALAAERGAAAIRALPEE